MARKKQRQGKATPQNSSTLALGSLTDVGRSRSSNQDAYCALLAPNAPAGTEALLAVADGMGGHQGGDVASTMAIQTLVQRFSPSGKGNTPPPSLDGHQSQLEQVVHQANGEVFQAATKPELRGMGTTLTVALLVDSTAILAQVGDSRAYLVRKGAIRRLTQDHSWVAEQVAAGVLTQEQAQTHPQRNILTRALGTTPHVQVDISQAALEEGDVLVLCSDGLHGLVSDEEMGRIVATEEPQKACQTLVDAANALGGHDNITVVIGRVDRLSIGTTGGAPQRERNQGTTVRLRTPPGAASAKRSWGRLLLRIAWTPLRLIGKLLLLVGKLLLRALRRRGSSTTPRKG